MTQPDIRIMFADAVARSLEPEPDRSHNTPGIPPLTPEEELTVEAGRQAVAVFRKSFDFWMSIACALHVLKAKADSIGGRKAFDLLRTREGLGPEVVHKSRVSRLLTILARLDEVESWRATLTDPQRTEWASSEAIYKHCPLFRPQPKDGGEDAALSPPRPSAKAQLANALAEQADLASLVERLERELAMRNDEVTDLERQVMLLRSEQALTLKRALAAEKAMDTLTKRLAELEQIAIPPSDFDKPREKASGRRAVRNTDRVPAAAEAGAGEPERKRARRVGRRAAAQAGPAAG